MVTSGQQSADRYASGMAVYSYPGYLVTIWGN